jgi:hypothetical protein
MKNRARVLLFLGTFLGVALASPLGDWLTARSDALWWQALPWVLLALFWCGIGLMLWQRRGAASHRA